MIPPPEIRQLTIKDYFDIVQKRLWLVTLVIVAIVGFVAIYDFSSPKIYEAKTSLLIEKQGVKLTGTEENFYGSGGRDVQYYQTQYAILLSRALAEKVIEALNLNRDPEFVNVPDLAGDMLDKMVKINPIKNSSIVTITVTGKEPLKIANIANTWAREYIRQDIEKKTGTAKYGVSWLESQVADTLVKLQESERKFNDFIKDNRIVTVPSIDADKQSLVEDLKREKGQIEQNMAEFSKRYKEKHPKMLAFRAQLKSTEDRLKDETDNFLELQEKMVEYRDLKRRVDTYKSLYEDLLKRAKELDISKELTISNIRVIDTAEVPRIPIKPETLRDIMKALAIAIFLSIGGCFLLEYMDSSLKTSEDVELYVKSPFLGYIPSTQYEAKDFKNVDLISHFKPQSRIAESFRSVRVSLMFSFPEDKPLKTMLITSSIPGEGKSFISSNLAIVFAQTNDKTLLIDADMRKGRLAKSYDVKSKNGLSGLLAGICSLEEAIVSTPIPNLFFLPAGQISPNPAELLGSAKLMEILKEAQAKFQRIVIDAPPVLNVTDPLILGDKCDGMILVVRARSTSLKFINEAKKILEKKVKVIGAVLNDAEIKKDHYYLYHYYSTPEKEKT